MDFIQTSNKQVDKFGPGKHGFSAGNPGLGVLATYLSNLWCDMLQQEIVNVVEAAGLTANPAVMTQLLQAIKLNSALVGVDTGAANSAVVTYSPVVPALVDGMVLWFKAAATNSGATTLNVNGLGAKAVVGGAHAALQGGEIVGNGKCMVVWNAALNSFVLIECTGAALQVGPATQNQHAPQMSQAAGVAGSASNLTMTLTAAAASGTMTADEIIVETALGGVRYCLPSFNKTVNLATVGAGGMDTGTAPVSGFVALYAIYNPTTGVSALLATNATAAAAPNIYGGANMPAGYTASGLVSVWPTNGASQLVIGVQQDRKFLCSAVQVLNATTVVTRTVLSIASAVPKNAKFYSGYINLLSSAASFMTINLWPPFTNSFITHPVNVTVAANAQHVVPFEGAHVSNQNIAYSNTNGAGVITININVTGYTI
ncbi:hypothetical protein [Variovorax atrisoli]|uniref:hypothetical protein n=1 Tax=Variovorax atrisoli TaxID=3394203 RepID=UPI003391D23C